MKKINRHTHMQIKETGWPEFDELSDCKCKELEAENERLRTRLERDLDRVKFLIPDNLDKAWLIGWREGIESTLSKRA